MKKVLLYFFIIAIYLIVIPNLAMATSWKFVKTNSYHWYDIYVDVESINKMQFNDHDEYFYVVKKAYHNEGRQYKINHDGIIHRQLNYSLFFNQSYRYPNRILVSCRRLTHYNFDNHVYFDYMYPEYMLCTPVIPGEEGYTILNFVISYCNTH